MKIIDYGSWFGSSSGTHGLENYSDSDVKDYDTKGRLVTQQNDNCQSKKQNILP